MKHSHSTQQPSTSTNQLLLSPYLTSTLNLNLNSVLPYLYIHCSISMVYVEELNLKVRLNGGFPIHRGRGFKKRALGSNPGMKLGATSLLFKASSSVHSPKTNSSNPSFYIIHISPTSNTKQCRWENTNTFYFPYYVSLELSI